MPWSMVAEGRFADPHTEQVFIDRVRLALAPPAVGASWAAMHTEHHGLVNLLDRTGLAVDETEAR